MIASGTGTMALFAARHFELKNSKSGCRVSMNRTGTLVHGNDQDINDTNRGDAPACEKAEGFGSKPMDIDVVAVPCVGSSLHLLDQMRRLDSVSGCHNIFPTVLRTQRDIGPTVESGVCSAIIRNEVVKCESEGSSERMFGDPCAAHYLLWRDLQGAMGMDFDLIYAPRAFELLLESFKYDGEYWKDCNILYYHCGGMEGNESQLGRYKYKKIITR